MAGHVVPIGLPGVAAGRRRHRRRAGVGDRGRQGGRHRVLVDAAEADRVGGVPGHVGDRDRGRGQIRPVAEGVGVRRGHAREGRIGVGDPVGDRGRMAGHVVPIGLPGVAAGRRRHRRRAGVGDRGRQGGRHRVLVDAAEADRVGGVPGHVGDRDRGRGQIRPVAEGVGVRRGHAREGRIGVGDPVGDRGRMAGHVVPIGLPGVAAGRRRHRRRAGVGDRGRQGGRHRVLVDAAEADRVGGVPGHVGDRDRGRGQIPSRR